MRTFIQKPALQQTSPTKSTMFGRVQFGQSREVKSMLRSGKMIGSQAMQQLLLGGSQTCDDESRATAAARFAHDFSQTPIHAAPQRRIQPKLTVSRPGDMYESEADRLADQVMRMHQPNVQRPYSCGEGCPKCQNQQEGQTQIQTKPTQGSDAGQAISSAEKVVSSPGQALTPVTRAFFEPRFGYDFSKVRVHTDSVSAQSAININALAYTFGNHIVFGRDKYKPQTSSGRALIAHELAHVLQQSQHRVSPLKIQRLPKNKSELEGSNPRYSYSDNCGWIDWGHVNPTLAQKLIDTVKATSRKMFVEEIPYRSATYHRPKLVYDESCPARYEVGEKRRSRRDPGSMDIARHKHGVREYYLSGFEVGKSDATRFDKFNHPLQKDLQEAAGAQSPPFSSPYYISVDGFTDCIDNNKNNLNLRQERAEAIKGFLYTGYSTKHYPYSASAHTILKEFISKNDSENGRRKNRGVLILATPEFTPEAKEFETPEMASTVKGFTLTSVKSRLKIYRSLSYREILGVSMWIFQDLTKFFEKEQSWTEAIGHSSFSNEDLPSNLIGFYMAAMNKKPTDMRKVVTPLCDVYDPGMSKIMFDLYRGRWKKTQTFIPEGFEDVWPTQFNSIEPIPPSKGIYELLDYEGTSNLSWFYQDAEGHRSER